MKTVASDVAEIIRVGSELGLSLNITKCELIAHNDLLVSDTLGYGSVISPSEGR